MATQFGLFGPTPEQLRMAEQARREQTFAQQAQGMGAFGPLYQISRGLTSQGINTLGQALFPEAQSPQLQQATALQALKQQYAGVDLSDPNNLMKLATDLSSVGAVDQAMQVATQAKEMMPKPNQVFSQINPKDFTPESVSEFAKTKDYSKLVPVEKPESQKRKTIGKAANSGEQVYQEGNEQFILRNGQKVPYYGSLRKEQGDITIGGKQEARILANKTAQAGKVEDNATAAVNQLANAEAIGGVLDRAFTGVGSDILLNVGQIANALGVQVSGTTESEQLEQLLAALTAGQARNLPGPLSEKELAFLKQSIGTRGVTRETLRATVNRLQEAAYADIIANNRLQKYINAGDDLNKFNFAKNASEAKKLARLLSKATPEQRRQILGE